MAQVKGLTKGESKLKESINNDARFTHRVSFLLDTYKELPVGKRLIELEKEFPTITAVMVKKQILDEV